MEILRIENNKYTPLCEKCQNILNFKINFDKLVVDGEFINGHIFNDISFYHFKRNIINTTSNIKKRYCHNCVKNKDSNTYLCQTCNKLFCMYCMAQHLKTENHKYVNYYNQDKNCQIHNKSYIYFCEYCKDNLCSECLHNHNNHSIKYLINIIPNNEEKKSITKKAKIIEERINKLYDNLKERKKLIDKRYEKLEDYFELLLDINSKLFYKFNYSIFDYHNFENLNYMNKLLNNQTIFEEKRYINYMAFGESLKMDDDQMEIKKTNNTQKEQNIKENNKNYVVFNDYSGSMEYFKDNLFYSIKYKSWLTNDQYIKLYEYKDFSFEQIFDCDISYLTRIDSIKKAKYGNYLLINFEKKKNIRFLEYDDNNKIFTLTKNEIKKKNFLLRSKFKDFIDLKNGDIITIDSGNITVWQKTKKKYYEEKMTFNNQLYSNLYNINDTMFFASTDNYITIFNCVEYGIISFINYMEDIEYFSTLNNELLLLKNNKIITLISLKFFEIVQKIELDENYYPLKAENNVLIQYYKKDKEIKFIKNEYNEIKRCFNEKIVKNLTFTNSYSNVLVTKDNKYVIFQKDLIIFLIDVF